MKLRELHEKYPSKEFGQVQVYRRYETVEYVPFPNNDESEIKDLDWELFLPHQCDDWEVGSVDEAMDLVNQLNFAIDYCNLNK